MSAAFYVLDAVGDKYLFTVADPDYEAAFRKHARWWLNYMRRPRTARGDAPRRPGAPGPGGTSGGPGHMSATRRERTVVRSAQLLDGGPP